MSHHRSTYAFGRIADGKLAAQFADGKTARLPLERTACLVVSRSDCHIVSLRLPRLPVRRLRRRVTEELPRAYPGSLAGIHYDYVAQPTAKNLQVIVVLMRQEDLRLYTDAAGPAGLSVLALLFAATCGSPSNRRRRAGLPALPARSAPPEEYLVGDGPERELVTVEGGVLVDSFTLPPDPISARSNRLRSPKGAVTEPRPRASRSRPFSPLVLPIRFPSRLLLFDQPRGVRRWMRSALLSPLFLLLALPLLIAANVTTLSLLSRRVGEVQHLREAVGRAVVSAGAEAAAEKRIEEITTRLSRRASQLRPDPYSILSALRRAVGDATTVKRFALSRQTATFELLSADPLDLLRRVEATPSVVSAELVGAGNRGPDGRFPLTLRVLYQ